MKHEEPRPGQFRVFSVDPDSGAHFFEKDFATHWEALNYVFTVRRHGGFYMIKDSKNQ